MQHMSQTCTITFTVTNVANVAALAVELEAVATALKKYGTVTATPLGNRGQLVLSSVEATSPQASRAEQVDPTERAKRIADARGVDFDKAMARPGASQNPVGAVMQEFRANRTIRNPTATLPGSTAETITPADVAVMPKGMKK